MSFDAIVHAPRLRTGARVNIAKADQSQDESPARIAEGAAVKVRFGVCCPDRADGTILDCTAEPHRAVLAVDGQSWVIMRGIGGISTPGLVSEDWFVAQPVSTP